MVINNKGCGAFLGDVEHKSILQLLAASEAGRDVIYYPFDIRPSFHKELREIYNLLQNKTVGQIYKAYEIFAALPYYYTGEESLKISSTNEYIKAEQSMGFFNFLRAYFRSNNQ